MPFLNLRLPVLRAPFSAARVAAPSPRPRDARHLQPSSPACPGTPASFPPRPCKHWCLAARGSSEDERGRGDDDPSAFFSKQFDGEDLQALDQFFLQCSMEEELVREARDAVALRQHLTARGDSSILTAAEEEEMQWLAARMGFSSSEDLVATFARITGEDPSYLHPMLGVMMPRIRRKIKLALAEAEAQMGPWEEGDGPDPSSARSEASDSSNTQSPGDDRVGGRQCLYPTTSGLAPNSDPHRRQT